MRLTLLLTVLALFCACAFAWEKEDYEIFDLVGAVEKAEGKGTTFYSWLDVPPTATTPQIAKAFRRKSIEMHPDKNIGVKGIHERFARLTVVGDILKNGERRKRYDFFYKNGVPKWRGTGYYYDRFRPGLGTVLTFLVLITSCMHYLVMEIQYRQDLTRVTRFVNDAKAAAWGPKLTPIEGKRKVKVPVGPSRVDEDGNVFASRGVEMVVEGSGDVYIVESNGDLTPLNATAATPPSFKRTWFFTLVTSLANKAKAKATGAGAGVDGDNGEEGDDSEYTDSTPGTPNSENSASTGALPRAAATKAGGKRRKVPKRK